jgi:preprotein translocase subunit SecG
MGAAFGGGATDVLLGAGSGNFLTKATKWCAGIFLGLCLLLSILSTNQVKARKLIIQEELRKAGSVPAQTTFSSTVPKASPAPPVVPPVNPSMLTSSTNSTVLLNTNAASTTAPAETAPAVAVPTSTTVVTQGNKRITITPVPTPAAPAPAPDKK